MDRETLKMEVLSFLVLNQNRPAMLYAEELMDLVLAAAKNPSGKNPLERVREFLDGFSKEDRDDVWTMLAGIRGPDCGDAYLKDVTTKVIRLALSSSFFTGYRSSHPPLYGIPKRREGETDQEYGTKLFGFLIDRKHAKGNEEHFITHAIKAILAIEKWQRKMDAPVDPIAAAIDKEAKDAAVPGKQ